MHFEKVNGPALFDVNAPILRLKKVRYRFSERDATKFEQNFIPWGWAKQEEKMNRKSTRRQFLKQTTEVAAITAAVSTLVSVRK